GETVADIPVSALTDEAPRYERPMASKGEQGRTKDDEGAAIEPLSVRAANRDPTLMEEPGASVGGGMDVVQPAPPTAPVFQDNPKAVSLNDALLRLLASPNLASKEWVYRQYDHMVRTNTVVLPGADAAVVRIKETRRALAMTLDGNGLYCAANPREGAKLIVAEAARNVVCVGARPLAITNCLNFASPERPHVMWSFSEVIDGMAEACRAFETPVVSGNVSFYNETEGRGILPTPVIGMVGLINDVRRVVQPSFKRAGDLIALLGTTEDDLSLGDYMAVIEGRTTDEMIQQGRVPRLDLERERAVQDACLRAAEAGLLNSAHDCADGGLAVALAESCFSSLNHAATGAEVELPGSLPHCTGLFSESPSRIIISFDPSALGQIEEIALRAACPFALLGRVGTERLRIAADSEELVSLRIDELEEAWRSSLGAQLQG
ncbi:MAG: phosphoribosylformylglycinamidine synthase II, partial [Pyrinomonadaceae bacterium]|nr:phosphoribosylformylglycinamidine synthase II [Pyrinomonadaceae bacterium]